MSHAFVIETAGTTAGIAVRTDGGFRFYSSHPTFHKLDGRQFDSLVKTERSVARLQALRRGAKDAA